MIEETEEQLIARLERLHQKHNPELPPKPVEELPDAPY